MEHAKGFEPFYDEKSKLLILGSFPSVMSRKEGFYYGNPQNRFWRTVCGFFGEPPPTGVAEKKDFLRRRNIALWDVVTECSVEGSKDASIQGEQVADVEGLLKKSKIETIFCNGSKAFETLERHFPTLLARARKLPSTSPANPRFSKEVWENALFAVFGEEI